MTRIVTSTQLKQKTGEILSYAIENKEEVIIQRYDVPKAVLVDYDAYQRMRDAEQELAFRRLHEIAETASARAAHLSDEDVDELIFLAIEEVRAERRARRTQIDSQPQ